jgi:ribosome maturation factor RimP
MRTSPRHVPARQGPSDKRSGQSSGRPGGETGGNGSGGQGGEHSGNGGGMGNGGPRADARLDALERLAEPVVRAGGLDLEEIQLIPAGRRRLLRIVVDAPGGAALDDMALVSQALSAELDAAGIMGEARYTLEVTSPGVDRPLTRPRHWRNSVGRMVRVPLTGHGAVAGRPGDRGDRGHGGDRGGASAARVVFGRVIAADDAGVVVDIEGSQRRFGFAELGPGKVQVEFSRDDTGESRGH